MCWGGNGVKCTTDIKKDSEAVGLLIDMALHVIGERRGGSLCRSVTVEAMLVGVERLKPDTLLYMPGTQAFQSLEYVVGKGYRAVGRGLGVRILPRFGEKNYRTLLPQAGSEVEVQTRPIYDTQDT